MLRATPAGDTLGDGHYAGQAAYLADVLQGSARLQAAQQAQRTRRVALRVQEHQVQPCLLNHTHQWRQHLQDACGEQTEGMWALP